MGRELKHRGIRFDLVLASTAARVRETIDGVREKYAFDAPIEFQQSIYLASAGALLALVRDLPDSIGAPLIVGHNPGLERLAAELTHDDSDGRRQRIATKYPTGALAVIELPVERWLDVVPGIGEIVELILPKDLD